MVRMKPGLELVGAQVPFGQQPGLVDLSLSVARGQRLALLGPSGAGKSTLLRALAGLAPMTAGTLLIDDKEVTNAPPERRGIVYLHQTPLLFPHLNVIDNVGFALEVRGRSRAEARHAVEPLLAQVRLLDVASRRADTLSGGQRHRVALARALAAQPAALLLDEPFASLDPSLRADVRDSVVGLLGHPDGPAAVIVTHDVDEACALGHQVALLLDGRLAQVGSPSDVLAAPHSLAVARFLGIDNLLPGTRDESGVVSCVLGSFAAVGRPGAVTLVCRPATIRATPATIDQAGYGTTVAAIVERVAGRLVRVYVGSQDLLATPSHPSIAAGAPVYLTLDTAALHVLDADA